MSRHRHPVLICYDVADPKRLRRVFREVRDVALPVQKSVFVAQLSEREIAMLMERLAECLDAGEDRLQVFALRELEPPQSLGKAMATGHAWVV